MTHTLVKLYLYFRNHRAAYWVSMVAFFALFGFCASQVCLDEDMSQLLPSSHQEGDETARLAFADLRIKDKTFLLFAGGEGVSAEHIAETCDAFVDSLMSAATVQQRVHDVFYRLPDDLMFDAADYLLQNLPAYVDTAFYARLDTMMTYEAMTRQMQRNHDDLTSVVGDMMPELIETDPLGLRRLLAERLSGGTGSYQLVEGHFFVPDSTVCVAFLTPRFSATNTGESAPLFELLNAQIEKFAATVPDVHVSYHGTPASGFYNARQIKHDLQLTILGSLLLVLTFIMVCFRNWDTLPLLLLLVVFGVLLGLSVMYFVKGSFSLLALGIGAVVLGVALSYVLHIITHYKYVDDPVDVLRDEAKPVCLGCLTTIGSLAGLLFVRTDLLRDFGLFAAAAIVDMVVFSLVYLPPLLSPGRNKVNRRIFDAIGRLNAYQPSNSRLLIGGVAVVTVVCICLWAGAGVRFDADLHNLGYRAKPVTDSELLLRTKTYTGEKQRYFASCGRTMEEALENFTILDRQLDSLERLGLVKGYTHTSQLLVPLSVQRERISAWKEYWTEARIARLHRLIAQTAPTAGLLPEAFDAFFDVVAADHQPDALYLTGIIPDRYLSTLMEQSYDGKYLCFTSVRCQNDMVRSSQSDYYRICDAIASQPGLLVLDTYYYTANSLQQLNDDFQLLQWLSMAFVFVVLLVSFRFCLRHVLLAFMPILFSWLMLLGCMVLFGVRFNLVNIIISTFVFGIGVDYSIVVMSGLTAEGNHRLLACHKTAILLSALVLMVTVGSMLLAAHPAIRSVGFTTLVGLTAAIVLSYVVQPAVYKLLHHKP